MDNTLPGKETKPSDPQRVGEVLCSSGTRPQGKAEVGLWTSGIPWGKRHPELRLKGLRPNRALRSRSREVARKGSNTNAEAALI